MVANWRPHQANGDPYFHITVADWKKTGSTGNRNAIF